MNLIRQQDKLKELYRAGILEPGHFHAALHAPVFDWSPAEGGRKLTHEEIEFVYHHLQTSDSNVPTVAPFDCFRISMKSCFDLWFRYPKERKWMLVRVAYAAPDTGPEQWLCNIYGWDVGSTCAYRAWRDGACLTHLLSDASGKIKPEVREQMKACVHTLCYFLFELMLPGNITLKVEPPIKPGKSVEWVLARTHYLILNRKQAELCRHRKQAPTETQIIRTAHWRRAHFRRLMAERFKQRGALIPVRYAWVGPKEWEGLDGKVYRVIDLH